MLKLIMVAILSLSSLTAFADHHTKDAQEITKAEKKAVAEKSIKKIGNVIPFSHEFNGWTIDALIKEIEKSVKAGDKKIIIKFDSGGGSIFAGFRLIHKIIELQGKGIQFIGVVDRLCASMCFMTYQYMDVRLAYPLAILMDHPASGGPDHILKEISEELRSQVLRRLREAKLSPVAIKMYELLVLNDFYMNIRTAKALGLLQLVIKPGMEHTIKVKPEVKKPVKKAIKK